MSTRRPPHTDRSPEVVERLERSRARIQQRRALARQRERAIQEAVKRYLTDWRAITACETKRDNEVEGLRQQISVIESRAAQEIAGYRADQAEAAAVIRDHGQTDDDVAELLEISAKQARQLITTARAHRGTPSPGASPTSTATPIEHPEPARHRHTETSRQQRAERVIDPADTVEARASARLRHAGDDLT
ncbi:hypothetical protein OH799_11145 [Nocardia sp. NBC_00881]|uniref:hypothetical protein n=1 Tax=Nocardia sp. NBC_00881 TaxID=2975995 RepID=UPI00386D8194|nr:hypothetical protein OH799_11145 [Nocardia sp. NBC_00881]